MDVHPLTNNFSISVTFTLLTELIITLLKQNNHKLNTNHWYEKILSLRANYILNITYLTPNTSLVLETV